VLRDQIRSSRDEDDKRALVKALHIIIKPRKEDNDSSGNCSSGGNVDSHNNEVEEIEAVKHLIGNVRLAYIILVIMELWSKFALCDDGHMQI
jgi:hypothetical protein